MNKLNISDELFSRFMDGKTSEAENERILRMLEENPELLDEFTAVCEASKLTDQKPLNEPDYDQAARQISSALHSKHQSMSLSKPFIRKHQSIYMAAAAVAVILLVSTVYLLLRPSNPQNTLVQGNGSSVDSTLTQPQKEQSYIAQNGTAESNVSEITTPAVESGNSSTAPVTTSTPDEEFHSSQMEERHYATSQEANNLSVTRPNKGNYMVLCKNLDKTIVFEWNASNVQSLHFSVTDSHGKIIAEITDPNARHYELSYRKLHPERQVTWKLSVTYKDNTQDNQSGQIQIDYNINHQ